MYKIRKIIGLSLAAMAGNAWALDPVPKDPGLNGFVALGGGGNRVESNMVADGSFGSSISKRRIDSIFDSPESESDMVPVFNFNVGYTFKSRTEVFVGTELIDVFRFDFSPGVGVKQELKDKGTVGATFLVPALPMKVWEDPYVEGERRNRTDRDSWGFRLGWRDILGSGFEARATYRDIDLDDELSGTFLRLSDRDKKLLDREGDFYEGELSYRWKINDRHRLTPALQYTYEDLDGRAMKSDAWGGQLTYSYGPKIAPSVVVNLYYARVNYDETNPIYRKTREDDRYGVAADYLYHEPFGFEDWSVVFSAGYYKEDANIDFYEGEILTGSVTALFNF